MSRLRSRQEALDKVKSGLEMLYTKDPDDCAKTALVLLKGCIDFIRPADIGDETAHTMAGLLNERIVVDTTVSH